MCERHPLHCVIPPYMLEHLAQSPHAKVRALAVASLGNAATFRTLRATAQAMPRLMAARSPELTRHRLVYNADGTNTLPGKLVRKEGQKAGRDAAVNEAYDGAGDVYDFYEQLFKRNSLDNAGMTLVSTVHLAEVDFSGDFVPLNNAFWNGEQMAYGDGDGEVFQRFTRSLEVIGHELTHGVQSFTSNLDYQGQSGALNEHFADVFGVLVRQWKEGTPVADADWLIGKELLVPAPTRRGIRDMLNPGTAYRDDPDLGDDPQPSTMDKLYTGAQDNGGVHINSGIPNRAFALAARAIGGNAWDTAGRIWYDTLLQLHNDAQFQDCARISVQVAGDRSANARRAVKAAWKKVGIGV